jgi:hypothetical protein
MAIALDTFQVVTSMLPEHYQELTIMVETELAHTVEQAGPLPAPRPGPGIAPGQELPHRAARGPQA